LRDRIEHPVAHHDYPVEAKLDLERALTALPRRQRAVMVLRYHLDLSADEVAKVLKISPGAVRMLAQRARETLAVKLNSESRDLGHLSPIKEDRHAD